MDGPSSSVAMAVKYDGSMAVGRDQMMALPKAQEDEMVFDTRIEVVQDEPTNAEKTVKAVSFFDGKSPFLTSKVADVVSADDWDFDRRSS